MLQQNKDRSEQISLRRSLEFALQFASGKNKLQIEALQKFLLRSKEKLLKNKRYLPSTILIALLLCIPAPANTDSSRIDQFENDLKEQQEDYRKDKKEEKEKPLTIEPFCRNLSQNVTWWQMTAAEIQKIKNNGLGYSELIKVILISKKIEKSPDDIIKKRNRGDTFLKISERYGFDYGQIKNETKKIMSEVKTYETK